MVSCQRPVFGRVSGEGKCWFFTDQLFFLLAYRGSEEGPHEGSSDCEKARIRHPISRRVFIVDKRSCYSNMTV